MRGNLAAAYDAVRHIRNPERRRQGFQVALRQLDETTPLPEGAPPAGAEVDFVDPRDGTPRTGVVHRMTRGRYGGWTIEIDDGDRMRFVGVGDLTDPYEED